MKKIIASITCIMFATGSLLSANESINQQLLAQNQVGKSAEDGANTGTSKAWKGWVFAGGVSVFAVAIALAATLGNASHSSSPHAHSH